MVHRSFPAIDPVETGRNIVRLRKERGLSVRDIQAWFNFEEPRAIYKWQSGQTLPSVDNLYALSVLLEVPMDSVIVGTDNSQYTKPQEIPVAHHFCAYHFRVPVIKKHITDHFFSQLPCGCLDPISSGHPIIAQWCYIEYTFPIVFPVDSFLIGFHSIIERI